TNSGSRSRTQQEKAIAHTTDAWPVPLSGYPPVFRYVDQPPNPDMIEFCFLFNPWIQIPATKFSSACRQALRVVRRST
ncbi:MAG: hypothetical protein ACO3Z6_16120, partial [Pseudomonadales bacterium]